MRLTVHAFVTVDGVVQGPGQVDEDVSGGFQRGGWQVPSFDEDMAEIVTGWFTTAEAILLGRTTYELFFPYWSQVTDAEDPVAPSLNELPKYVASTTLTDPRWQHTTVLAGDVLERIRELKARPGKELQVHGSWGLLQSLHGTGLVDEYRLLVCPVVVGGGKRLFADGAPATGFTVVDSRVTRSGATYTALVPTEFRAGAYTVVDGREVIVR